MDIGLDRRRLGDSAGRYTRRRKSKFRYDLARFHNAERLCQHFGDLEARQRHHGHSCVVLSYTVNDWMTLMGGVATTFNNGVNFRGVRNGKVSETEKTYMGMVMLTAPTNSLGFLGGSTLSATVVNGLNSASGNTA